MKECWRFFYLWKDGRVIDFIIRKKNVIMKVSTWKEIDVLIHYSFIVVLQCHGIGPCLVGRMSHIPVGPANKCVDEFLIFNDLGFCPLLEFNYDYVVLAVIITTGNNEIYSMAAVRKSVLNANSGVISNVFCHNYRSHVL